MSFNWLILGGEGGIAGPDYTTKTDFTNDYMQTAAHAVNESTYYFTLKEVAVRKNISLSYQFIDP